jgi:large subunit ribosomal protein L19
MNSNVLEAVTKSSMKEKVPAFNIGDTVEVHVRVKEGEKERIQVFRGTVLGRKGSGIHESFKVRRIVQGEGVERTFPIHSPFVADIKVVREGHVRRAKLYYLRDRVGKGTKVRAKKQTGR